MTHGGLKHFASQAPGLRPGSCGTAHTPGAAERDKEAGDRDGPAPLASVQAGFLSRRSLRTHRPKVTTLTQESPQGCEMDVTPTASKQHGDFATGKPREKDTYICKARAGLHARARRLCSDQIWSRPACHCPSRDPGSLCASPSTGPRVLVNVLVPGLPSVL